MKLVGKRVLVTGGSSGIGLAIAKALLAKGATVAISGRRSAVVSSALAELHDTAGGAAGIVADVGTAEGRTQTLQRALDARGGLNIVVNNADGVRAGRLEVTSEAEIEAMPYPLFFDDQVSHECGCRAADTYVAAASLSCVFVSKSLASWRSWSWLDNSPRTRLTMRPRRTAGRSRTVSAHRWTCL